MYNEGKVDYFCEEVALADAEVLAHFPISVSVQPVLIEIPLTLQIHRYPTIRQIPWHSDIASNFIL